MKTKIEIKNRFNNEGLFSTEIEDNTLLECVREAVKAGANLSGAHLSGANLSGANLYGANLSEASLYGANLSGANLSGANLSRANLSEANLSEASLYGANLSEASLYGANLSRANLSGANLSGANLSRANLSEANLSGAKIDNIIIKKAMVIHGLYKYLTMPIIAEDGKYYIKLGCHLRSVEEWENDFWNNNNEFPDDGSIKSHLRVLAFETAKKWLEINK
jgi:uncharacterized protein YjbI with pentapeptide repeats